MNAGLNLFLFHRKEYFLAIYILGEKQWINVINRCLILKIGERNGEPFDTAEKFCVMVGQFPSLRVSLIEFLELNESEGSSHFINAIVQSGLKHIVRYGSSFVT